MASPAAARKISSEHLRALDTAARAAQKLANLGCTGVRLVGNDRHIPLIQMDPPPPEAHLLRTSYYGEESAQEVRQVCLSYYAGAVLFWVEARHKPRGRLH